jgi:hypothetical protein
MIANIASDDALILPHPANPARMEFSGTTGFGFITPDDGSVDVFDPC